MPRNNDDEIRRAQEAARKEAERNVYRGAISEISTTIRNIEWQLDELSSSGKYLYDKLNGEYCASDGSRGRIISVFEQTVDSNNANYGVFARSISRRLEELRMKQYHAQNILNSI